MYLGSDYDSWRTDNGEPSHFKCPECWEVKDIDELAHNDEMCCDCYSQKLEDELDQYREAGAWK